MSSHFKSIYYAIYILFCNNLGVWPLMYSCECSYLVSDQHDLHKTDVVLVI